MSTTEYKLQATPGGPEVTAVLVNPDNAFSLMVLGPGAGTPIHRPLMVQLADDLAQHGVATFRYNYPYAERGDAYVVEDIDPLDTLLATTTAARKTAQTLLPDLPLFLGGRSMSAQVVSLGLAREDLPEVCGVVLYVFPSRWQHVLADTTAHLLDVPVPMLFIQGSRDELAPIPELEEVLESLGNQATMHVIEGANHSYELPPESDRTQKDAIKESASVTARWMQALVQLEGGA